MLLSVAISVRPNRSNPSGMFTLCASPCQNRTVICSSILLTTQAETLLVDLDVRLLRDLAVLVNFRLLKGREF